MHKTPSRQGKQPQEIPTTNRKLQERGRKEEEKSHPAHPIIRIRRLPAYNRPFIINNRVRDARDALLRGAVDHVFHFVSVGWGREECEDLEPGSESATERPRPGKEEPEIRERDDNQKERQGKARMQEIINPAQEQDGKE